jgi:RNA polymerase sigma-70 factor (ECF subfamily)
MHYFAGQPVADIARTLGISVGTVTSRLTRGRDALRDVLLSTYRADAA